MDYNELIHPELLILIPLLNMIGLWIKNTEKIPNKYIPLILGGSGIITAMVYLFASSSDAGVLQTIFNGIIQGILCAGASVYANQLVKQAAKTE